MLKQWPAGIVLKALTKRRLLRWFHMLATISVVGYIYGPVSRIPEAARVVRWLIAPLGVLKGLWMWHCIHNRYNVLFVIFLL